MQVSLKKEHAIKIEGGINKKARDEKGLKNTDRAEWKDCRKKRIKGRSNEDVNEQDSKGERRLQMANYKIRT